MQGLQIARGTSLHVRGGRVVCGFNLWSQLVLCFATHDCLLIFSLCRLKMTGCHYNFKVNVDFHFAILQFAVYGLRREADCAQQVWGLRLEVDVLQAVGVSTWPQSVAGRPRKHKLVSVARVAVAADQDHFVEEIKSSIVYVMFSSIHYLAS